MFLSSAFPQADRNAQPAKDHMSRQRPQPRQSKDEKSGGGRWGDEGIPGNAWGANNNEGSHNGGQDWPGSKDTKPQHQHKGSSDQQDGSLNNGGNNEGTSGETGSGRNDSPPSTPANNSSDGGQVSPGGSPGGEVPPSGGNGGNGTPPASPQPSAVVPPTAPAPTASAPPSPTAPSSPRPTILTLGDADQGLPVNAAVPLTETTLAPGSDETRRTDPTSPSSSASPATDTATGAGHEGHSSNKAVVIAVTVSLLVLILAGSFLYRYLRARRTNSRVHRGFPRRAPSFHDESRPSSRGDSLQDQPMEDTFSSNLSSMSFASHGPMVQLHPSVTHPPSVHRHSSSSWTETSSDNSSKLGTHPLPHSDFSIFPSSPVDPPLVKQILPISSAGHNTGLSHSSFASTGLSYTDPFSDHASPSTAFATSPEPISSFAPSSEWYTTTESVASFPNTFSSTSSNGSSIREPRIIIVGSSRSDDSDSSFNFPILFAKPDSMHDQIRFYDIIQT